MSDTQAHAESAYDPGASILHHILDSKEWEVPFTHKVIHLPDLPFGIPFTKHIVVMLLAFAIVFVVARWAAKRGADGVPRGFRGAIEAMVIYIRDDVARRAIGEGADRHLPFLLTLFFFILTCNLLGLVPGSATATGNISVTAGLAVASFIVIQLAGVRRYGVVGHMKNQVPHGLPGWLVPLMIVIEYLSNLIRPFALCIRLFANMMAGHVVILAFISMIFIFASLFNSVAGYGVAPVSVFFALFVHFLEILVAFLQAYIFTMLTAQFIGLSEHPAH